MTEHRDHDIRRVLENYPADCQPVAEGITAAEPGFSGARLWRVRTPQGDLCLRRWPHPSPEPQRLAGMQTVLRQAISAGCSFLAAPIDTLVSSSGGGQCYVQHGGHRWGLEPWLPGQAETSRLPSIPRVEAALWALATFHVASAVEAGLQESANSAGLPPAAGIPERRQMLRSAATQLTALQEVTSVAHRQASLAATLLPAAQRFLQTVESAINQADELLSAAMNAQTEGSRGQPCLCDIWREHVLFDPANTSGEQVSGIVDYGAMACGEVTLDISRLSASYAEEFYAVPGRPDQLLSTEPLASPTKFTLTRNKPGRPGWRPIDRSARLRSRMWRAWPGTALFRQSCRG